MSESLVIDDLIHRKQAAIACPYPIFAGLRAQEGVQFNADLGAWIITRYDDVRAILGLFFLFRLFSLFCPASASEWAWRGREREREDFVSEGDKLCFSSRKKTGGVERGADETTQAVIRPIRSIVPCALWRVILGIKTPARAKNES